MSLESFALAAATACEKNFDSHLEDLKRLARIPSISFPNFPPEPVAKSAEAVAALLKKSGLKNVEIMTLPGVHPYVYGEWLENPDAPTLLLYAHHDVQPAGREALWKTPPFEPTLAEGPGGTRLYGRGTADDKAGVVVHTAAIDSWLKAYGKLPVNVKVVIEGEEEIGSAHLEQFLQKYREKLQADVIVLTDTSNFDCGVPALTTALRGLVAMDLEVRALTKSVHSGMWGGPVPDPVQGLAKMLATLTDENGAIAVPEIQAMVRPISADERARFAKIPYDESSFRAASGMVKGAKILSQTRSPDDAISPIAQLWRLPSLTVTVAEASSRQQGGNIINDMAYARITIRLVPDMDPAKVFEALKKHLQKVAPWGLEVSCLGDPSHGAPSWSIEPKGPAFDAASTAMKKGYGVEPIFFGCGGTIPFVKPFAATLGGAPALLVGVEDPYTNAHGENESLLVSDFKKACLSQVHLFGELAARVKKK